MLSINDVVIDRELEDYLPVLADDEKSNLIESIKKHGIMDPVIVWLGHRILIDGHNRYTVWVTELKSDPDKAPDIVEMAFNSKDEVKEWMIRKQLARRNLTDAARIKFALLLKPVVAAKAKDNQKQSKGAGKKGLANLPNLNTRTEVAKQAGASSRNVAKVEKVLKEAPKQVQDDMLSGKMSINAAHKTVAESKPPKAKPEPETEPTERPSQFDPEKFDKPATTKGKSGDGRAACEKKLATVRDSLERAKEGLGPLIRAVDDCQSLKTLWNHKSIVETFRRLDKETNEAWTTMLAFSKSWNASEKK